MLVSVKTTRSSGLASRRCLMLVTVDSNKRTLHHFENEHVPAILALVKEAKTIARRRWGVRVGEAYTLILLGGGKRSRLRRRARAPIRLTL
jgi:uncharacterized RmlC-like cupin family protein